MISNLLSNLDWLAVLLATVAYFVIGAAWYGILGKGWMEAAICVPLQSGDPQKHAYSFLTLSVILPGTWR